MAEGVIAVDMDEHIISMNPAAAAMFGVRVMESQDRPIQEAVRNSDLQRFVKQALAGDQKTEGDIVLYHEKERVLWTHSTPLRDSENRPIGILVVMNDVTELRRLENLRRDFVANVSHEIKTPLTAIKGFVETLEHGAAEEPEEARRFLGIINRHVDRLSKTCSSCPASSGTTRRARFDSPKPPSMRRSAAPLDSVRPGPRKREFASRWTAAPRSGRRSTPP